MQFRSKALLNNRFSPRTPGFMPPPPGEILDPPLRYQETRQFDNKSFSERGPRLRQCLMNPYNLSSQNSGVTTVFVVMGDDKVISTVYAHGRNKGSILKGDLLELPSNF